MTDPTIPPALDEFSTSPSDLRALAMVGALTIIGDFLLWPAVPGLSLAIFVACAGLALAFHRRHLDWTRNAAGAAGLLILSLGATVTEFSFTNFMVLLALLFVVAGETSHGSLRAGWSRWSESAFTFLKAPGRWFWVLKVMRQVQAGNGRWGASVIGFLRIVLPPLLLGGLFAMLLISGNLILGKWTSQFVNQLARWLESFDISFGRVFLWGMLGTFSLALLRPARASEKPRFWNRPISPAGEPRDPMIARWRSLSILALLNGLFFIANTTDALFLWTNFRLPAGVGFSDYVHQGVTSLIVAVLLSAVVMVFVFQQAASVAATRLMKALGLLWIAQNGLLIASVLLRLKRYVDAYQLSTERVYVAFFLLLVSAGFCLLARYILRARGLNWLLFRNALAVFTLFFIVQFLDVAGWVADYNVACWQRNSQGTIDLDYLQILGSSAWPAMITVAQSLNRPASSEARDRLQRIEENEQSLAAGSNWRSWQWRQAQHRQALLSGWELKAGQMH